MSDSQILPKFFVTHSFRDAAFARHLADDLRGYGLEGFFDIYSIKPGDSIAERISQGLDECDVYVPILSFDALGSRWCRMEINAAITLSNESGRNGHPRIIPVLTENCQSEMFALLRGLLYINFTGRYEEALQELLENGFGINVQDIEKESRKKAEARQRAHESAEQEQVAREGEGAERSDLVNIVEEPEAQVKAEQEVPPQLHVKATPFQIAVLVAGIILLGVSVFSLSNLLTANPSSAINTPLSTSNELYVDIGAEPGDGSAPLTVDLVAKVSGSATGPITYSFDCTSDGSWEQEITTELAEYRALRLCSYTRPGNYTATIKAARQNGSFQGTVAIIAR